MRPGVPLAIRTVTRANAAAHKLIWTLEADFDYPLQVKPRSLSGKAPPVALTTDATVGFRQPLRAARSDGKNCSRRSRT